jgi:NAD(P)-dependent dehydrogenase (short-subunit alcohol dehydrogenase family)
MSNPVILITGALTGIGRATAFAFADQGARIVVSGRHDDAGEALVAELLAKGADAAFIRADVTREQEIAALIDGTIARFGRIDVAVNNAGTEGDTGPIAQAEAETYRTVFETNVLGVLLSLKHELRAMAKQGGGSIVNISSTLGSRVAPGASIYAASKHAVEALTKTAALEGAADGIRVNAVAPGGTDTAMFTRFTGSDERKAALIANVPMKRMGEPGEVAQAIVYLASDAASFVTGQILAVDGGKLAG